jgi:hypothetical protein
LEQFFSFCDKRNLEALTSHTTPVEAYKIFQKRSSTSILSAILALGSQEPDKLKILLEAFQKYESKWKNIQVELNGTDLIELGIPKGEQVGVILRQLLFAKLSGNVRNRNDEIRYVKTLLGEVEPTDTMERYTRQESRYAPPTD